MEEDNDQIYPEGYIYKLTFIVKMDIYEYVGSTVHIKNRINTHLDQPYKQLQYMFNNFGSYEWHVIQKYHHITRKQLYEYEIEYIKKYQPYLNKLHSICYVPCKICKVKLLYEDLQIHLSNKHKELPKIRLKTIGIPINLKELPKIRLKTIGIPCVKLTDSKLTKFLFDQYYNLIKPNPLTINLLYDAIDKKLLISLIKLHLGKQPK